MSKEEFEKVSMEFSRLQNQMNELIGARSQLETQFQENKIVLDEFELLDDSAKIYKLTGPVLLPQEYSEAKMNVEKRIDFIKGEITRVEDKIKLSELDMAAAREKLLAIRSQLM
ncbi:prefoldin subunit [Kocuria palustris]|nr:prefoldin subunit [Kocuria palustris]